MNDSLYSFPRVRINIFLILISLIFGSLLFSSTAWSHTTANHFFNLELDAQTLNGEILLAVSDLEYALGLDQSGDGIITWKEITQSSDQINTYIFSHLKISITHASATQNCNLEHPSYALKNLSDGPYLSLLFKGSCKLKTETSLQGLNVEDSIFFENDSQHKGILSFTYQDQSTNFIFNKNQTHTLLNLKSLSKKSGILGFIKEGVIHIWSGYDHLLFLLALILPIFSVPNVRISHRFFDLVKVITAFSVAHSLTLSSVVFEWIFIPSRIVESLIAFSVVIAGLNVIWPFFKHKAWLIGFGFGLIHGFGFASAIGDLDWQQGQVFINVLSFNLGVEIGQIAVVTLALPFLLSLKKFEKINLFLNPLLGAMVAGFGAYWLCERLSS